MIRHSVILTLKSTISDTSKDLFFKEAQKLSEIPKVQNFELLNQVSTKNPFEYGISMEFATQEDYDTYTNHPQHQEFIVRYWIPLVADFLEIDCKPFTI
jgi:heme-degrading monooxygenase HmoA